MKKIEHFHELLHLCCWGWWESGNEIWVCGRLSRCRGRHSHDRCCWCGHGHGDRRLSHHGLLMLGDDGGHGHSQGGQVGHRWRRKLTQDFHIQYWEASLKNKADPFVLNSLKSKSSRKYIYFFIHFSCKRASMRHASLWQYTLYSSCKRDSHSKHSTKST